jgi:uncharacterized SAM-binding protein YcdF (DUF218 family)
MKTEYMLLSVLAGWLLRGLVSAYQNRNSLTPTQMAKVVIFGGGGPPPVK